MKRIIFALLAGLLTLVPVLAAALEVGEEAPLFEAVSDKGPINLIDYRGQNVVLAFYFSDFTPV